RDLVVGLQFKLGVVELGGQGLGMDGGRQRIGGGAAGGWRADGGQGGQPSVDLRLAAEAQQGTADAETGAGAETTDLHDGAVDARAVGAFQAGEDEFAVVELDLGVETAHALVVEPEDVAFLTANGNGRGQLAEHAALVDSFEHLKGYRRHRNTLRGARLPLRE